jgi:hypothetical protein
MAGLFRSVVLGFAFVSVVGTSSLSARSYPVRSTTVELISKTLDDGGLSGKDVAKVAVDYVVTTNAVPAVVTVASELGVTASTGTAISTLSGAAATNATVAAVGSSVSTALGAAGIVVTPMVVGGAVITCVAIGVAYGINTLFLDDE